LLVNELYRHQNARYNDKNYAGNIFVQAFVKVHTFTQHVFLCCVIDLGPSSGISIAVLQLVRRTNRKS